MDLSQRQDLIQQQTLHLTAELRQGLAVLQLDAADLAEYVSSCIEENPVLVDEGRLSDSGESRRMRHDETPSDNPAEQAPLTTADANRTVYSGIDARTSRLSTDALLEGRGHGSPATFDHERHDMSQRTFSIDRYLEVSETLAEHLMTQVRLQTRDERIRGIANYIAASLDSSGYLTMSVSEIAADIEVGETEVEGALALVQGLHPIGVAARNLAECLRLQLDALGLMTPVLADLLDSHLADLEKKSIASVARDMGVSKDVLNAALDDIRRCNPRPGLQFSSSADSVWPEVVVEREDDGTYRVRINDFYLPDLKVDEHYRTMAATSGDRRAARYLEEKIREAEGLIEGVAYRRATLYKVACCITEMQVEFFDEGFDRLRPLTMAQVAQLVGVSTSTVSRLVNGNYMQTPRGTFELRFFFHASAQASGDVEVSSVSVKRLIAQMIEAEDPSRPLSDQAISDALREEGVEVSRRTIAKYRGQLGIPVRAARKR